MTEPDDGGPDLEDLLTYLRDSRSLDFTGYKRPSLTRRIRKRMHAVDIRDFVDYRDYLEVHPDEHKALVDTILINVTSFFRDTDAWDYLSAEVIPAILAAKSDDAPIRIWSAGCATGEEPYSLAMAFGDALDKEAFKARVKIYATDTDESALDLGRSGIFTDAQLEPVLPEQRTRYFEPEGDRFAFRSDYRRSVIFGRLDITRDAPISRLDLLVCRNVLMYLNRDAQRRTLSRFHYALGDAGYLFLGRAETIFAHADLFAPVSSKYRVFNRAAASSRSQALSIAAATNLDPVSDGRYLSDLAAAASPVAQLVVDSDGTLVEANTRAMAMFGVRRADIGHPFRDLEVSFRPIELRSRIEQAFARSKPVVQRSVKRPLADGESQFLDVTIAPLLDAAGIALGASLTFADVTELSEMKNDLEQSGRELELANEGLNSANEELETSNEELQSTNEELETTNEELQSANEELETMNEELQSANEELETMNEELLDQAQQIERSGRFLSELLDSLTVGVVVVTDQFDVLLWNRAMEDMFGLRSEEVTSRSLLALEFGVQVGEIGPLLHAATDDGTTAPVEVISEAMNRRGQPFTCRVTVAKLEDGQRAEPSDDRSRLIVLFDPVPAPQP